METSTNFVYFATLTIENAELQHLNLSLTISNLNFAFKFERTNSIMFFEIIVTLKVKKNLMDLTFRQMPFNSECVIGKTEIDRRENSPLLEIDR